MNAPSEINHATLASAFVKAQTGFAPALKNSVNGGFKSKYADLAACVEAVIDSLNANGLALIQKPSGDDSCVSVETILIHESGEQMSFGSFSIPVTKHDAHGTMSALTYCRRGSLMSAMGIAPEDDDSNAASKAKPQARASSEQLSEDAAMLASYKLAAEKGMDALKKFHKETHGESKTRVWEVHSEALKAEAMAVEVTA